MSEPAWNFTTIDRPYNSLLERSDLSTETSASTGGSTATPAGATTATTPVSGSSQSGSNGNVEVQPVRSPGGMSDVWITNFIRSDNWKPKKVGFYIDGKTGKAEFTNVYVSGQVFALSGLIGGFTIGATDLSATANGNKTIVSSGLVAFTAGPNGAPNFTITQAGAITAVSGTIAGWTLNPGSLTSSGITLDSLNKRIFSTNYVSGINGAGFSLDSDLLEVGNISARGLIRTSVFQKDTISTVGGNILVLDGDVLAEDMTSLDNCTMTVKGITTFGIADILRIKDDWNRDEWFRVTDVSQAPVYTVARDVSLDYGVDTNPEWKKGATVVNYGIYGKGGVYMTASESSAPYLSVFDHEGEPWDTVNTRVRIGNLNGYLGYGTDVYGIAIGDSDKYFKYDPINGVSMQGNITIGLTDSVRGGQTDFFTGNGFFLGHSGDDYKFSIGDADNYVTWDGVYLKIKGSFDVGSSGVINNAVYTVATLPIAPTSVGYNNPSGIE